MELWVSTLRSSCDHREHLGHGVGSLLSQALLLGVGLNVWHLWPCAPEAVVSCGNLAVGWVGFPG